MAKQKTSLAAKFLLAIVAVVVLILAVFIWISSDPGRSLRLAFTPGEPFKAPSGGALDYTDPGLWAALPGKASTAGELPEGVVSIAQVPEADVFYVHPTTYLSRDFWNAPLDDDMANTRVDKSMIRGHGSALSLAGQLYAPRYRQATFGAFFDESGDGVKAIGFAFGDVLSAFDNYIANRNNGRPFILAGHSQGSLHLIYLLQQRINGTALADRMIAAYIIGWPVSIEADLGALADIGPCEAADDTGCVISYQTFGADGDPSMILNYMDITVGLGGTPRAGTTMLCTDPLSWTIGGRADASQHLGAVAIPADRDIPLGPIIPTFTGTRCSETGVLLLDRNPDDAWRDYMMAGENFHVYDYHMFYMNLRENAALRAKTWLDAHR